MKFKLMLPVLVMSLAFVLLLLGLKQPAQADPGDVLVDRSIGIDQPSCGDGIDPPCYSIEYAVQNVAVAGDRVLVAPGTYTETFHMQPGVQIVSQAGPEVTRIDGEDVRGPMVIASNVNITSTTRLEGFTITGGNAAAGAGIAINSASPVISNCHVMTNSGAYGGGISISNASAKVLIINSDIISNTASGDAAGIRVNGAVLTLTHSTVVSNTAELWGGGVMGYPDATLHISDTLFRDNSATQGGGLMVADSDLQLYNSEFISNTAGSGGAVHVRGTSTFYIFNNTFIHNEARGVGGIGFYDGAGSAGNHTVISNTISFNSTTVDRAGGIGVYGSTVVISGNHIISNTTNDRPGGGMHLVGVDAEVEIFNNLIMHNAASSGAGISAEQGNFDVISNTIIYNEVTGGGGGVRVGDNATTVISGNHILSNTSPTASGGGISILNSGYTEIQHNEVAYNVGTYAAGIRFINTDGIIYNNRIHHNIEADAGGGGRGMYLEGTGTVEAYNNWISNNDEGGLVSSCMTVTLANNVIAQNTGSGPQVNISTGTDPLLINNTVVGNATTNGIEIKHGSVPTLINNIFVNNNVGIWGDGASVPVLVNNLTWDNSQSNYWNMDPGTGDVSCDPDLIDVNIDDFHLGICSCAVDAGTNSGAPVDDYDGNIRPVDGDAYGTAVVDIGAYERLYATAPLPVASFTHATELLNVEFTNTSSYAMTYQWDFGDSVGLSAFTNPTYTYTLPGTYPVQLTATCAWGCSDVFQDDVTVTAIYLFLPMVVHNFQ